jgi:uncharacterized RDD family membrane protein YckC
MNPSNKTQSGPGPSSGYVGLATVRERFAAQVIDAIACGLLFGFPAFRAEHFARIGGSLPSWAAQVDPRMIAAGVFILASFVYFVVMEWLANGTLGKLLCRLRVVNLDRKHCGFVSALVRNFTRPVDLLAGPLLAMLSPLRQRLGDRIAETLVVRLTRPEGAQLEPPEFAAWEQRARAAIVDFVLLTGFAVAYVADTRLLSGGPRLAVGLDGVALLALPVLLFAYFAGMEAIFGATIGKMFSRLRVVYLNGEPGDFTTATIRTLARPLEMTAAYLPSILLVKFTRNRQRLGDILAGSSVARTGKVHPAGPWAAAIVAVIVAALVTHTVATGGAREIFALLAAR